MEKEIIKKYQEGKSISQLLIEFPNYNRRQINKIFAENNITIRGGRKKKDLTQEQVKEAKALINDGALLIDLSKHFNLDRETMGIKLKELGLEIKNTKRINRHLKSDYFQTIDSPIKAYWLGFLFTDGSVDHYKATGRIRLQLQASDLEILEKFQEDLCIESKIIYDKRPNSVCCSVEFVDEQIYNDLAKYDIIPNKTYNISNIPYQKIPKEYRAAFALGLFDGDGNLFCSDDYSKDVAFGYTAYHKTEVEDFQKLINELVPEVSKNKIYFTSAWHTQWRGRLQVLSILDILYKDCPRFLKRKHDIYLALKNSIN